MDKKFIPWQYPISGNSIESDFKTLKSEALNTYCDSKEKVLGMSKLIS
jgi:hypothetical protein